MIETFLIVFALYWLSDILAKKGKINSVVQKQFWNTSLFVSFLIVALTSIKMGLRDTDFASALNFLPKSAHIDFGFIMIAIAFCHIAWHWQYFKAICCAKKS